MSQRAATETPKSCGTGFQPVTETDGGFGQPDPELAARWRGMRNAECERLKDESGSAISNRQSTIANRQSPTSHPVIRQRARDRYLDDEAAAAMAARHAGRSPPPLDLRLLRWGFELGFRWYERVRSFLLFHRSGFVRPAVRAHRLVHCAACSFRKDRGDGVMVCAYRQASCGCPTSLIAGIWYLSYWWRFECPLGRFGKGTGEPECDIPDPEQAPTAEDAECAEKPRNLPASSTD